MTLLSAGDVQLDRNPQNSDLDSGLGPIEFRMVEFLLREPGRADLEARVRRWPPRFIIEGSIRRSNIFIGLRGRSSRALLPDEETLGCLRAQLAALRLSAVQTA
jgi:hypothetical protein